MCVRISFAVLRLSICLLATISWHVFALSPLSYYGHQLVQGVYEGLNGHSSPLLSTSSVPGNIADYPVPSYPLISLHQSFNRPLSENGAGK
jgi:hypothetical protein